MHGVAEDKLNKPYRPIPSGRMSLETAARLRWLVVVLGFVHSRLYSAEVLCANVANLAFNLVYNDLELDKAHWAVRQVLLGIGYTPYHYGATLVAGEFSAAVFFNLHRL